MHLRILAHSEPEGIVVEWKGELALDQLPDLSTLLERMLRWRHEVLARPESRAASPVSTEGYRFVGFAVREMSIDERRRRVRADLELPSYVRSVGLLAVRHYSECGMRFGVEPLGPAVAYEALADALLANVRGRLPSGD